MIRRRLPRYYECSCCCFLHPVGFDGDCRSNVDRFTPAELDILHDQQWIEVAEPAMEGDDAS